MPGLFAPNWRQMRDNVCMNSLQTGFLRRRWLVGLGAASALAGAGLAWWRTRPAPADPHAFWQERFERPEGGDITTAGLRGRPLLVNFWATWCPPCVEELPMIDVFWRENNANGFQVLALAIDQPSAVRRFLGRQPLSFPVGLAGLQGTALAASLGNTQGGLPFSVFFKPDGGVWRQKLGQLTPQDLQDWRKQGQA